MNFLNKLLLYIVIPKYEIVDYSAQLESPDKNTGNDA
ncbi:hypothetical protein JL09_g5830 [Pichia kudriavzevii]|uniref:Uncharacterized protein n=1 Tax=Pichia kudriavzevii TaxID=4909 RepID=A0A099NT23_PICKU|nr:hypothetical protein JL09_g5830 [Pichia kudriavzevii]